MFKRLLLSTLLLFVFVFAGFAQKVAGLEMGTSYAVAMVHLQNKFGMPSFTHKDMIIYQNIKLGELYFAKAIFGFSYRRGHSYLYRIALMQEEKSEEKAAEDMERIKNVLSEKYDNIEQIEEKKGVLFVNHIIM